MAKEENPGRSSSGAAYSARAFVFYQAVSPSSEPRSAEVRCGLFDNSRGIPVVACARVLGSGTATIHWQVVELPAQVAAFQRSITCSNNSTTYSLNRSVVLGKTFTLYGGTAGGNQYTRNDFRAVRLSSERQVELLAGNNDCVDAVWVVQVAEWTGLVVERGVTDAMTGETLAVSGLPSVAPERTFLLHTHRLADEVMDTNERTVSGSITGSSSLEFRRHRKGAARPISAIAYERVTLPEGARVQELELTLLDSSLEATLDITAVSPNRTFVFASGQSLSGQGNGASLSASAPLSSARATFELLDSTRVRVRRVNATGATQFTVYVVELPL